MTKALEITNLTTKVAGYTILNQLSLSVDANELRVLLGPNGAGKTTLIDMITGRYKPHAGKISFYGKDITGKSPDIIFREGISRKFQVPNLYETLSIFDNVMLSLKGERRVMHNLFRQRNAFVFYLDINRQIAIGIFFGVHPGAHPSDSRQG